MKFQELAEREGDFIGLYPSPPAYTSRPRAEDRMATNCIHTVILAPAPDGWISRPNMTLTRRFGKGTRNGVRDVSENMLWIYWFRVPPAIV